MGKSRMTVEEVAEHISPAEIINRALQMAPNLPDKGILAGGFVANLINERIRNVPAVLNDVDIFIPEEYDEVWRKVGQETMRFTNVNYEQVNSLGELVGMIDIRTIYRIIKSQRDGNLNTTRVAFYRETASALEQAEALIAGFDLNCCQAAILLETRQFVLGDRFLDFLASGQLEVTWSFTPWASALRLCRKAVDTKSFVDMNREMALLIATPESRWNGQDSLPAFRKGFHTKDLGTYYEHRSTLERWFRLSSLTSTAHSFDEGSVSAAVTVFPKLMKLIPIAEPIIPLGDLCDYELKMYGQILHYRTTKAQRHKREMVYASDKLRTFLIAVPGYADCDFTHQHVSIANAFFTAHPLLAWFFIKCHLNLQRQIAEIARLKQYEKKYGEWVYGILENMPCNLLPTALADEWLTIQCEAYIDELDNRLCESAVLPEVMPFNAKVRELITKRDLIIEGHSQHHCVGGYSGAVKSGQSRIFSIEVEDVRSTLQISLEDQWEVVQHRGKCNCTVPKHHSDVAEFICKCLNEQLKICRNDGKESHVLAV